MSEVQSRPSVPRGRGPSRAGRGSHASRAGARSSDRPVNGEVLQAIPNVSLDDQGELGQLKKQYMSQLDTLKELFPDWTDDDLVFALQETDGDLQSTIERITEEKVSRFADVKKKTKEKSRSKAKDVSTPNTEVQIAPTQGRGRGGFEGSRGGRGRVSERGRGGSRGGRGRVFASINGSRSTTVAPSMPTIESAGWGDMSNTTGIANESTWDQPAIGSGAENSAEGQWDTGAAPDSAFAPPIEIHKSSLIPEGATKSWASILAPPKTPAASKMEPAHTPIAEPDVQLENPAVIQDMLDAEYGPKSPMEHEIPQPGRPALETMPSESSFNLVPPRDKLTEDNLEHLPDVSIPAATDTVVSTRDARSAIDSMPPYGSSHGLALGRPPMGGYATSAWKATGMPGRSASYQRRMMEQQEAVVMPGNHAVDRAAVQFGSIGLSNETESKPLDIDDDREDAQTRAQPPQQSPSQPRASLPPAAYQQPSNSEQSFEDGMPTPKQAPGLPPVLHTHAGNSSGQQSLENHLGIQSMSQPGPQVGLQQPQYGRYGSGSLDHEDTIPVQKPYDPFSQQLNYPQSRHDSQGMYPSHSQTSSQPPQQAQSHIGSFFQGSHSQSDYNPHFSSDNQRNSYQRYYGGPYDRQESLSQNQENLAPQRSGGGYGVGDSSYGNSQVNLTHSRYGEPQTSGHTTPNPTPASQTQPGSHSQQGQLLQQQQQPQGQAGHSGGYPYGNPYYSGSYYGQYMNQFPNQYNYNHQGYGGQYGAKGGVYGQSQHSYGATPQGGYDHSASPANTGGFGSSSMQGRDSTYSGAFNEYGRAGSTQPPQGPPALPTSGAFPGSMPDSFGRSSSNYASHNQPYGQPQDGANEDSLKAYHDIKTGPSSTLGQPGRTSSAANNIGQQHSQPNYPPSQSHQQSYGGYPSHSNQPHSSQGSQYGGLGGLGGLGGQQGTAQAHQGGGGYSGYGGGFGNSSYGNYGRGGWGSNYQGH